MAGQNASKNAEREPRDKWYNRRPSTTVRRFGVFAIGASAILFAAYGVFPDSHYVGVLLGAALVAVLGLAELSIGHWLVFTAWVAVLAVGVCWLVGPNLPEETENHGWLLPGKDPDPPNNCNFPPEGLSFIMGTNVGWTPAHERISYVFGLNKTPLIAAARDGDKLAFDVDVFNEKGVLAVRIEKNEFHLIQGEYSYGEDRSKDRTSLVVHDKKGEELLRIRYANPRTVFITGVFYASDGTKATITPDMLTAYEGATIEFSHNCSRGALEVERGVNGSVIIK